SARVIAKPTHQKRKGTHRSQRDAGSAWLSRRLGSWRLRMDSRWQQRQVTSADRAARLARSGALREKRRCRDPRLGPGAVPLYDAWPTRNDWASRWRGGNFRAAPLRLPRLVAVENDLPGQAADVPKKAARGIAMDVRLRLPERSHATRDPARYRSSEPAIGLCPPTSGSPSATSIRPDLGAALLTLTHPHEASPNHTSISI